MRLKSSLGLLLILGLLGALTPVLAEEVWVSGRPATVDHLRQVLAGRGWSSLPSRPLGPGEQWSDNLGNRVINLDWSPPESGIVALSDHPETVERRGGLFFGGLTRLRPLIFQYYHLGRLAGTEPNLTLVLSNPGNREATVFFQSGVGVPSLDYFSSGHTNNVEWFKARRQGLGHFITIDPGSSRSVFEQPLTFDYVVSGTLGLTQLDGPPLQFALVARQEQDEPLSLNNLLKETDVHSRGFYPAAVQRVHRTFYSDQEPINVAIGAVRQQTFSGVRELRGDYGVTYEMSVDLVNNSAEPSQVELLFVPRGGAATGTFLVDGELVEVPLTQAFEEHPFQLIELKAYESRPLKIETIPEGASSYPVRIVVRSRTAMI